MDPKHIKKYTLINRNGISVEILNLGGIISSIRTPDKKGDFKDIVLGFDNTELYLNDHPYFGSIIGRYANRIANGAFIIDGVKYSLATNNKLNHLHGGLIGFDKVFWDTQKFSSKDGEGIILNYFSKHLDQGYPGNLCVKVTYLLNNDNFLKVAYEATTDQKTIINLTQHSYFNLSGDFSQSILDHELMLDSDTFLSIDKNQIPTGYFNPVKNTPFDFKNSKKIGKDFDNDDNLQLKIGNGYDHCWILENKNGIEKVAQVYHSTSGRQINVYTDQPGIQLYTGNFLDNTLPSKSGGTYGPNSGFCLETQHYPDSPNQSKFPSTLLLPEQVFKTETWFEFTTK
jgi:aldose 1-epimerase